jgi:hypothetical protein
MQIENEVIPFWAVYPKAQNNNKRFKPLIEDQAYTYPGKYIHPKKYQTFVIQEIGDLE